MSYITLKDFYLKYPYKCYDINSSTIPVPYVKKNELECGHEFTKTYQEYFEIADTIFSEIQNTLLEGSPYKLPKRMGTLQMFKYKTLRKVIFVTDETGKKIRKRIKSPHTGDHYPVLKWLRSYKECVMWTRWHFTIKIMSLFSDRIREKITKTPSIIYQYSDAINKRTKE